MIINYEKDKINNVLYDFYNSTGITIDILKADFTPVIPKQYGVNKYCKCIQNTDTGKKACTLSDRMLLKKCKVTKQIEKHICHAGLIDVAAPILYEDEIIGYIIFGRMKTDLDFDDIKAYIQELKLDYNIMKNNYDIIPFYNSEKIKSVSNIASMLVKYILLENMLKPSINENVQKAVNYINENLDNDLSIKTISKNTNVSKSVLYKKFHEYFNSTISEYINAKRAEKSIELLKKTEHSIEEISQKAGFSSASYYSRIFRKIYGKAPLKYKKENLS